MTMAGVYCEAGSQAQSRGLAGPEPNPAARGRGWDDYGLWSLCIARIMSSLLSSTAYLCGGLVVVIRSSLAAHRSPNSVAV